MFIINLVAIYPSLHVSIHLSTHLSVCLSIHPFINHPDIHLSIWGVTQLAWKSSQFSAWPIKNFPDSYSHQWKSWSSCLASCARCWICRRNSENMSSPPSWIWNQTNLLAVQSSEGTGLLFSSRIVSQTLTVAEIVPVEVEDHVKPTDLSTPWRRGTYWLVWCQRGACTSLGQSPTNLSDGESITSERRRVPDLTRNRPLCAKRLWKGDVSNDRYAVAADAVQKSTTLDVTGERTMNMQLKRTGVWVCVCWGGLAQLDRQGWIRNEGQPEFLLPSWLTCSERGWSGSLGRWGMRLRIRALCHSWPSNTMEVCDIWSMTIPMNHWRGADAVKNQPVWLRDFED